MRAKVVYTENMKNALTGTVKNPFPPIWDENSRILILGSLPSEASRAAGFYYMNPRNRFWKMLSEILGCDLEAMSAEQKAEALLCHGIALSDVILSCEIHRSADASIKRPQCTDIPTILSRAHIKRILLNGNKAFDLFLHFFPQYEHLARKMPSTSPANAKLRLPDLVERWSKELIEDK